MALEFPVGRESVTEHNPAPGAGQLMLGGSGGDVGRGSVGFRPARLKSGATRIVPDAGPNLIKPGSTRLTPVISSC